MASQAGIASVLVHSANRWVQIGGGVWASQAGIASVLVDSANRWV